MRRGTKIAAESLSSSQQVGVHVPGDIHGSEANSKEEEGGTEVGFPQALQLPLPQAPKPASFPVTARAPSSPAAPRHRESLAGGTACEQAGLALGEDGAFPEQMKSSKTLSCRSKKPTHFSSF